MSNVKTNTRYRAYQFSLRVINLVKDLPQTKIYLIFIDQLSLELLLPLALI